jgi:hypothetical protein
MSPRQIRKPKISDSDPEKAFHAIAKGLKHPPNLAIDSLSQHNTQARGRNRVNFLNSGSLAVEKISTQQFRRKRWVPRPIQRHLIFFLDLVTRVGKPLRQAAIICEKKQTFSLRVQTPDIEEAGKLLWKQIKNCVTRVRISSSRNKSSGFVQHNRQRWSHANKFAIDFDVVARAWVCAEVRADFTVDRDATGRDQLIAISARTDASGGEETV